MRHILGLFCILLFMNACSNEDDGLLLNEKNFLIFGHFYGECGGEGCVETFKLTGTTLYEDTLDDYAGRERNFIALDNGTFLLVKDLANQFPSQLLAITDDFIGCPDCADGGGIFIQYVTDNQVRTWRIDQIKSNIPNFLHAFVDQVNEKIGLINE